MKKITVLFLLYFAVCLGGCNYSNSETIKGSGTIIEIGKDYTDFTKLDISNTCHAVVSGGDKYQIKIRIDDNIKEYLEVSSSNGVFSLGLKPGFNFRNVTFEAEITMPELSSVDLSGASKIEVSGVKTTENFDCRISGASSFDGKLESDNSKFHISGASKVNVDGKTQSLSIEVSGASKFSGESLVSESCKVDLSGASKARVNVNKIIDVDLSGASSLVYKGNPKIASESITGASSMHKE